MPMAKQPYSPVNSRTADRRRSATPRARNRDKSGGLEARFRAPFIDSDGRCDAGMRIENDRTRRTDPLARPPRSTAPLTAGQNEDNRADRSARADELVKRDARCPAASFILDIGRARPTKKCLRHFAQNCDTAEG